MKTSTKLKKAKQLLLTKGWTKGELARDENGKGLYWDSPVAVSFCAEGAISRAGGGYSELSTYTFCSVSAFNDADDTTLDDVITLFDWAIGEAVSNGD